MGRKSELSVRVNIDPVLDRDKFNGDVDKLTKTNPVPIHGKIDAEEALSSIADYQQKANKSVPIVAKISNAQAALDEAFANRQDATPIKAEISAGSLAVIKGQLQDVINSLDLSKLNISTTVSNSANTAVPKTVKQTVEQTVVQKVASDKIQPQTAKVRCSKKPITIDDDKILNQMAEAQAKAAKAEESELAAAKQKNIIYQNLVDHQAKAAENATNASNQTAKGLSSANKAMSDLNVKSEAFEQNWKRIVTLIAGATRDLTDLMVGEYGAAKGKGMEVFGAFQEFDKELPNLDTYDQKEYLAKIKNWANDLIASVNGEFDPSVMQSAIHMFSGLADTWSKIDPSKLTDMVTMKSKKENVLQSMTELQNIFPSSTNGDPFWGAKESAINYLVDLLGNAAKYYAEVGSAAKQTADSIATANQGFANQTAQLKQTNAELEKAKQNIGNVSNSSLQTPILSDISKKVDDTKPVDLHGKVVLTADDVTPPETPIDIPGKVTLTANDITVPDKIDLNGNLVIKNATKEIKAATKEAEAEVSKESKKASKKDAEKEKQRKKKEYLLALGSLLKKNANAQNELSDMYPGAPDHEELQDYIKKLHRRTGTTVDLLDTLVGRDGWKNDVLYTSAVEDSMHIRSRKKAGDKTSETIKAGIAEEKEYVSILKQIPDLEKAATKALADFGDQSVHYQDANKKLTDAKDNVRAFEQKYGEAYSDLLRSEVIEQQNLSKAMAQEKAIRDAQLAQEEEANKKRIADEKKYLSLLTQETKDHQTALEVQREYGDKDFRTQYAMEDWQKSNTDLKTLEATVKKQSGSLSNVPGYNEIVKKNRRSWMQWGQDQQDLSAKKRAADLKDNTSLLNNYNKALETQAKLLQGLYKIDQSKDPGGYAAKQIALQSNAINVANLRKNIKNRGLDRESSYTDANAKYLAGINAANLTKTQKANEKVVAEERKNIAQYEKLLKTKYDYQRKISNAHKDTDTKVWEDIVAKDDIKLSALKTNLKKNQSVIDELDLIEKSYIVAAEDRDNNALDKTVSKQQSDYIKDIIFDYKTLTSLQNKRSSLFKPEDVDRLNDVDEAIQRITVSMRNTYGQARNTGFDLNADSAVKTQMENLAVATRISKRDFKNNQDANNLKANVKLLEQYNQELIKQFRLYKELKQVDPNNAPDLAAKQMAFDNQKALVNDLRKEIHQKKLNTTSDYKQLTSQYDANVAGFDKVQDIKTNKIIDSDAIKAINDAKKKYLDAYDAVQKKREELSKTDDIATKQTIQNAIAVQRGIMKSAGREINFYGKNYNNLVSDAWNEISIHRNDSQIKGQLAYEVKSNKEAAITKKENLDLLKQYNQSLNEELKLLKQVYAAETAEGKAAAQNALNDQKDITENLRKQLKGKGLDVTPDYQKYNTQNALNEAAINAKYNGTSIEDLKNTYIKNLREREANINAAYSTEDADKIARITQRIEDNNKAIQEAGFALTQFGQKANDAWAEISKVNDELDIAAEQKFNKALEAQIKQADTQAKKAISDNEKLLNRIERAMRNQEKAYSDYQSSEDNTQDKETKLGRLNIRNEELKGLRQQAGTRGLTVTQEYLTLEKQHREEILGIDEALQKRAQAEQEAIRVQDKDRLSLLAYIKTIEKYKDTLEKDNKTDSAVYGKSVGMSNAGWDLLNELNKNPDNKDQVANLWGQKYNLQGVTDLESAFKALAVEAAKAGIEVQDLRTETEKFRADTQAKTNVANIKSQLMDYLEKFPKVEKYLAEPVQKLKAALADPNAYKDAGRLKQAMAELRAQAKSLGLESENLIDKFQKLFGQHLSTMITMAALHKMQDALRIVYQNVVEIDTAVTELRKVSEYAGKSLEEYMGRAAEQAQKLGVSISDYINSTADWKRLGYSDEDAENLATYSTLLKNVGDNIDDVNTSSSYLISTLQGFGLLADQAEDVVNKIDAVANTQPVTAKDLGEILTRSSAAMSAANNTLEETIALGTAANAVIQDADTVGTTLKSLSMYLRAAKSDAENAGIEVDGMANSVSELRSELKSLTGVDIMLDSKNFKSTYQIMKELSQVWSGLSDVTQANVTEMIGGKRNANAVSAILNNFDVAESAMESAANSANVAWEENEKWLDSIQGRLGQLDASFQVLSQDVLSSDLVKAGVSFLTSIVKLLDKIINLTGALPAGLGIAAFATQLGKPKMTGFTIVPSNTPGGDTEQVLRRYFIISLRSAREYLVKPTNMVA